MPSQYLAKVTSLTYAHRHLAKFEMEEITEDRWDEDIWGIEHLVSDPDSNTPKLIFYFGENVS